MHLVFGVKSKSIQWLNQYFNKSENCLQETPHYFALRGEAVRSAGFSIPFSHYESYCLISKKERWGYKGKGVRLFYKIFLLPQSLNVMKYYHSVNLFVTFLYVLAVWYWDVQTLVFANAALLESYQRFSHKTIHWILFHALPSDMELQWIFKIPGAILVHHLIFKQSLSVSKICMTLQLHQGWKIKIVRKGWYGTKYSKMDQVKFVEVSH